MRNSYTLTALVVALIALAGAAIAFNNGSTRPLKGHEIFVAETASEMIAGRDYLVPRYNAEPRLQKPPLAYWLSIGFHRLLGNGASPVVSELEARLPSLISGVALLAVTFLLGLAAFGDRRIGLLAAGLLATSSIFFTFSRNARPEMLYALLCTVQLLGLVIAAKRDAAGRSAIPGAILAWVAVAGALLAKGPQFPIFLLAGAALALPLRAGHTRLRRVLHPALGLIAVALVAPYYAYLVANIDGAIALWSREVVQNTAVPLWLRPLRLYYPFSLLLAMVPWIALLGFGAVHCWKRRDPYALMMAFPILIAVACLSFVGKLRPHYVLPLVPAAAVLIAWATVELFDRARVDNHARWLADKLITCQAALIVLLLAVVAAFSLQEDPVSGHPMWPTAAPWLALAALTALAATRFGRARPAWAVGGMGASLLAVSLAISQGGLDVSRYWATAEAFARQMARTVPPDAPLAYQNVQSAALIYYGRRIGPQLQIAEWVKTHGRAHLPWLVCRGSCTYQGRELEGEVVLKQKDAGQRRILVLFKPKGAQLETRMANPAPPLPRSIRNDAARTRP
ncbi:MAG: glycosyltransferase family 39 protein [Alphaproteobacteria bacterium]|nr:glycosyltransferase family 39 protein [Alphaproteobacteria bacterium]